MCVRELFLYQGQHPSPIHHTSLPSPPIRLLAARFPVGCAPFLNHRPHVVLQGDHVPYPLLLVGCTPPSRSLSFSLSHARARSLFPEPPHPLALTFSHLHSNLERTTDAERRARDRSFDEDCLKDLRQAAEAHRQVRYDVMSWIKPGMKMFDIAERLEAKSREMIGVSPLDG